MREVVGNKFEVGWDRRSEMWLQKNSRPNIVKG